MITKKSKIGPYMVMNGLLTKEQAQDLLEYQLRTHKVGKIRDRFGGIAVQKSYVTVRHVA